MGVTACVWRPWPSALPPSSLCDSRNRPTLVRVTITLLMPAVATTTLLLALDGETAGIRQRLLILIACAWQLSVLFLAGDPAERG